jgi:hypothetical protein
MKSVSRSLRLMLAVAIGLTMSLAFTTSATAHSSPPEATWELSDGEQRICIPAEEPYTNYFIAFIRGSWDAPLTSDLEGMPEGTVVTPDGAYPPGDTGGGESYLGAMWILVELPPLDHGEYHAELVVTDGTVTQTQPIVIKAQERWGCWSRT